MSMTRRTFAGVALAATAAAASGPARAQTAWNMPTPYGDGNFHTQNIREFVAEVARATSNALTINVHSAGSLFPHSQIRRNVRQGLAPIGEILISLHANESPIYGLDSVPFLAVSFDEARRLYTAHRPLLERRLGEEGLTLLFSVPWPPQGLFARREINSVEDLRGLRFRTYNPGTARIAAISGATPVQVEVPDLPTAFATGRVESTITSAATGVDTRIWEFTTHYHDIQAWIPRNMVFANTQALGALPAAQRDALLAAADVGLDPIAELFERLGAQAHARVAQARAQRHKARRASHVRQRARGATIAQEWESQAGADGVTILRAYRGG